MAELVWPADLGHGTFTGRFGFMDADGPDPDREPDVVSATGGTVTITPSVKSVRYAGVDGPMILVARPAQGIIDREGYLCSSDGTRGMVFPATDDTDLTPTDWTYEVSVVLDGRVRLGTFNVKLPEGETVDLSLAAPVPASGGTAVVVDPSTATRAEAAATRAEAAADAAEEWTPTFEWDGTYLVTDGVRSPSLKGEKGEKGDAGPEGPYGGTAVTDPQVASWVEDPGAVTRVAVSGVVAQGVAPLIAQQVPKIAEIPGGVGVTIPLDIIRTRDGYLTNINPRRRHTPATGPTYYVDPVNGSDGNDGLTESTALKTLFYASQKEGNAWAEIVITESGTFDRAGGVFLVKKGGTVRTLPGVKATVICGDRLTTWAEAGGAYTAPIATCNGVFDAGWTDPHGDPTPLRGVASVAEVQATRGTYHYASGVVTVHLPDDRAPDGDVYVGRTVSGTGWHASAVGNDASAYLEGIEWWGGTTAGNFTARGDNWRLYAKNCGWHGAGSGNGLAAWGLSEVILDGCTANHNRLDGFNYTDNAGRSGQFIEINCEARNNGIDGGSNNGSTSHDNYRGLRVAGNYYGNQGANVADVGNTRTYNVGCAAGGSTSYRQDFYVNATSQMWVDGCLSTSESSLTAIDTATIYTRETATAGSVTGDVRAY